MSTTLKPATTYPAIIGRTIVEMRKEKGLSQGDLSSGVNVTPSTWSKVERGVSALSIEQLALAAQTIGVSPSEITLKADEASRKLQEQGVDVRNERLSDENNTGVILIGVAAIALAITAVLSSRK